MTATFAIANQKGGVAKTTNTANVAGALADAGHRVLAVDADPQGYLTRLLGFTEVYNAATPTLADALREPREADLADLIVEHAEFDVLPSSVDMFTVQQDLIAAGWKPRERLSLLFEQLEDLGYDAVVVDAPPSLGVINDNVLIATQNLVVPVQAEETSIHALDILLTQIETLEERYRLAIGIRAVLVSNVAYPLDNEQREMIDYFEETFSGNTPVHEIRSRAAIKRSLKAGGSVFGPDAEPTDMKAVYSRIAHDVMAPEVTAR
jgi:chromosome partitioning protein